MTRRALASLRRRLGARRIAIGVVVPLVALATGLTALAYWTSTGTGAAQASVGALEPAAISAPASSAGTVTLAWDSQATMVPGSESAAIIYTVERKLGAGGFAAVSSGPCSGPLPHSTDSCDDAVTVSGSYSYRVVARYVSSWTALSNEVTVAVTLDSDPPATTVSFPGDTTTVNAIAFGAGCTPTGICGTATDASGVDTVRVSVRRQGGGYWTGSGFGGFSEYYVDATLLSPGATTTSWGLPLPLPQDGAYTVHVQAKDVVGNDSAPAATSSTTFAIDTAGPTTSLTTDPASPNGANGWFRRPFVDFTLTATDPAPGSGVAGTSYRIGGGPWLSYGGTPVSIATQGDHLVTYGSVDNAGNPGPTGTARIAIDNVSPATAVALSPVSPNGSNGWRRTPTSFTLSATDATSGVASTSYRIDGGPVALATGGAVAIPEGQHTVTYWSEDVAGNPEPPVVTPTIKVDTLAPSTTIATIPASPDGDNGWFRQSSVSFTLNGTDATSGIASRHYTIDGGTTQAYTGPVAIATPGAHVVTFWSVDAAGNVEVAGTTNVKIDAVAPTTVITSVPAGPDGSNGWFKRSSVTFTLAATDATSGVASTVYTVDGGAPTTYGGAVTLATQGDHTITFRSTDTAGNVESTKSVHIKLDDVGPSTSLATTPSSPSGSNGWFTSTVSFTLTATDATSGVATRYYRLDGTAAQVFTGAVLVAQGDHTVEYWSVDNAGNEGAHTTTNIKLDTAAPVTTLATTPAAPDGTNGWFKRASVTFTLTATDATPGSGVGVRRYTVDGGAPQTYTGAAVSVATQGDHLITYWSTDNAGNAESVKTTHIKLDNVAPTVEAGLVNAGAAVMSGTTIVYRRDATPTTSRTFRIRATVTDAASQPASASFPVLSASGWSHAAEGPVTAPGSGVYDSSAFTWLTSASNPAGYTFSVVDQAGNVASKALTFANDMIAPTGVLTLGPSPVGALLTATTLYYRSNAPGSFTLVDTVTDPGAGPASATFPLMSTSGWAHAAETVSSGNGTAPTIAYGSSQYTWTAGAGAPSSTERTITSTDRVGNAGTTTLTFTVDNTGPTGGALRVNGMDATAAGSSSASNNAGFSIGLRDDYDSDAGSGFASSVLTRRAASFVGGACGTFGAAAVLVGSPSQNGLADGCYLYTLTGTDNLGNTSSVSTTVRVDSTPPVVVLTGVEDGGGFHEIFRGTTSEVSGTITIRVFRGGSQVQAFTLTPTSSSWSYETEIFDLFIGLAYTARVEQTDAAGNTAVGNTISFTGF